MYLPNKSISHLLVVAAIHFNVLAFVYHGAKKRSNSSSYDFDRDSTLFYTAYIKLLANALSYVSVALQLLLFASD